MLIARASSCSSVSRTDRAGCRVRTWPRISAALTSGTLSVVETQPIVTMSFSVLHSPCASPLRCTGGCPGWPVVVRLVDRLPPGTRADAEQPRLGERVVEVAAEQAERSRRIAVLDAVEDAHLFEPVDATLHRARLPAEAPRERAHRIGEHLAGVASCVVRKSIGRYSIADPAVPEHVRPPRLDVRCPAPSRSARS